MQGRRSPVNARTRLVDGAVGIVVLGAGAVPETVKSGGIVLDVDTGVIEFAEVVAEVITNKKLQSQLRRAGVARLNEGFAENSAQKFVELVLGITV